MVIVVGEMEREQEVEEQYDDNVVQDDAGIDVGFVVLLQSDMAELGTVVVAQVLGNGVVTIGALKYMKEEEEGEAQIVVAMMVWS